MARTRFISARRWFASVRESKSTAHVNSSRLFYLGDTSAGMSNTRTNDDTPADTFDIETAARAPQIHFLSTFDIRAQDRMGNYLGLQRADVLLTS